MYAEFLTIEIALFKILHWFSQGVRTIRTEPLTLGSFIIGNPRLDFLKLLNIYAEFLNIAIALFKIIHWISQSLGNTNAKFLSIIILLFKTLN